MELNYIVIILNDCIVAVCFFIVGFYVSEYKRKKELQKAPPTAVKKAKPRKKAEVVDKFSGMSHETIMEEIRNMRSKK